MNSNAAGAAANSGAAARAEQFAIPMSFEPNVGQAREDVRFMGRGRGMSVYLSREAIAIQVPGGAGAARGGDGSRQGTVTLRVKDGGALGWRAEGKLPGESNYFIGNDRRDWHTGVPHFERVEAPDAAPGVGIAVYGTDDGVEYDLRVARGADARKLRLMLSGASDLRMDAAGDLLMNVAGDQVRMKKPRIYEAPRSGWHASGKHRHASVGARRAKKYSPRNSARSRTIRRDGAGHGRGANPCGRKYARGLPAGTQAPCPGAPKTPAKIPAPAEREVEGGYTIEADGSIGFRIGPHDPDAALVVDPSLSVSYATFLGGSGADSAASIAVDKAGKIYVGGTTASTSFSGALPKRLGPADGPTQFFVAKIDPTQTGAASLVYLTFLGGGGSQKGGIIAVDASGDVAVTGTTTATDYPVTDTSTPTNGLSSSLGNDIAISELNPAGSGLVFSTLFGGSGTESLNGPGGIALDSAGDVYIAADVQTSIIDSASPDLPVTTGAYLTAWDGETGDAFLAVLKPPAAAGGAVTVKYCTYLGLNSVVEPGIGGVAVDASGAAYVAGYTSIGTNPFPVKNPIQSAYGGGASDGFLMKIAPAGGGANDLIYSTLLGGSSADEALAVAVDSANPPNAYVAGTTQSPNFPTKGVVGAYESAMQADAAANAFLAVLSQNAITGQPTLAYATYFGGSATNSGNGVAVGAPNAVYLTGGTSSWSLPWHDNLQPFSGLGDAYVAKFDPTTPGAGGLIYVTPLGGTSPPGGTASAVGNAIAADNAGHVYVAGSTTSADFPTAVTTQSALNGFEPQCASCGSSSAVSDGFAAEIVESGAPMPSVYFSVGRVIFNNFAAGETQSAPVGLLNGGEAPLVITDIEVSGPNATDFPLSLGGNCLNQGIAPGPAVQCSFEVEFTPTTGGPESATVLVSDNAPGSPQKLELTASGQGVSATASPATLDFASQPENSQSEPKEIVLSNTGQLTLTVTSVVEGGSDPGAFALSLGSDPGIPACQPSVPIAPLAQCVLKYTFDPNALRTFNAQIQLTESAGPNASAQQTVALTGVGVPAAPLASLSQMSLGFGSETAGGTTSAQTVSMTNLGSATLNVSGISLAGTNPADFAMVAPASGTACPTGGSALAVKATCSIAVQFAPQTAGPKTAALVFTDNAAPGSQQVTLTGTATPAATLQVSPASLTFVNQSASTTSAPQTVTIANSGSTPAEVDGISIQGANQADFSAPASCTPNPVAAGKSCQINVTFTPGATASGARTANLVVPGGTPASVALAGTATATAPSVTVPTQFTFGSEVAGGAGSGPQPLAVKNSSSPPNGGTLTVTSITESGANPADFPVVSDSCTGANTPAGGTCTIQLAFKPLPAPTCGASGTRTATLSISDNAPGSPHTVPLSGTAMSFCITTAPAQAVQGPITAGSPATYLLEVDSHAGFTGSAALACAIQIPSTNPPEPDYVSGCSLGTTPATNPAAVQITPQAPGQFQVTVATSATPLGTAAGRAPGAPPASGWRNRGGPWLALAALLLLAAVPIRAQRGARIKLAQVAVLAVASAVLLAACGGGGAATIDPPPPPGNFSYTVVVTATFSAVGQPNVQTQYSIPVTVAVN